MGLGKRLWKNTLLLTVSALIMRGVGMLWQTWLIRRIGAEGIGLFQLVMSVGFLFVTVSVSGIRFAVTRLLSEELGRRRGGSISAVIKRAAVYTLFFSLAAAATLFFAAEAIGTRWINDARAVPSLRWMALSLPAAGLSNLIAGYFTAVGRVWKNAAEQFGEQLFRMALTVLALRRSAGAPVSVICAAVVCAGSAADILGAAALGLLYSADRRRHAAPGRIGEDLTVRLFRLALPLAVSAYARSALNTFRQLLVPRGLRLSGMDPASALAGYGVINGMAMTILTFPACLPAALSELLVPALTEAQVAGEHKRLRQTVEGLVEKTFLFSLAAGALFFVSADVLSGVLYHSREGAVYVRLLSPMVPLIYTDIVTDGCLKGLGQMMRSMTYNIAEAALGLVLVWALLPRWALQGYVFILYLCEIFNFSLSIHRLDVITR